MQHICKTEKSQWLSSTSVSKEIHEDFMETIGKESPSYNTVYKWVAEFKRGGETVDDDGQSGCPYDANADERKTD